MDTWEYLESDIWYLNTIGGQILLVAYDGKWSLSIHQGMCTMSTKQSQYSSKEGTLEPYHPYQKYPSISNHCNGLYCQVTSIRRIWFNLDNDWSCSVKKKVRKSQKKTAFSHEKSKEKTQKTDFSLTFHDWKLFFFWLFLTFSFTED